jgi:NAD(P)-dependent dehydrogenase (short-subunit alcohol dehydrogenase family)
VGSRSAIVTALTAAGRDVSSVARTAPAPSSAPHHHVLADATDPAVAARLIRQGDPDALVLVAGATPIMLAPQRHTWESFSVNWHTDVKIAFHWLREALLTPLRPGSIVVVISSGAALAGSPLSGGYAGAKATQRFLAEYAQAESDIAGLGIRFVTVLPRLTPLTSLGKAAVAAYAARSGSTEENYVRQLGGPLSPAQVGDAVVHLVQSPREELSPAYLLAASGLQRLP